MNGYQIAKYTGSSTTLWLPAYIGGKPVTGIADNAFKDRTLLTKFVIPDSVTNIGSDAFYNTGYYNRDSNWQNGVLYIGKYLIKVKDILLGNYEVKSGTLAIAGHAFSSRACLTSITIPDSVTSVGDYAFDGCIGLTSIIIPGSVTSIGAGAFCGCTNLTSITISDGVTSIGDDAFYDTGYYNCDDNWQSGVLYIGKHLIDTKNTLSGNYQIKSGTLTIAGKAFSGCTNLTSVAIPSSVVSIGDEAFRGCTGLTNIIVPNGVTSIGDYAFSDCWGLTSITIPDSVISIGYAAFSNCWGLTSITIPDGVTSIGEWAFDNCTSLTTIRYGGTVTQWKAISKGDFWADNTGNFVVYCSDGTIAKDNA